MKLESGLFRAKPIHQEMAEIYDTLELQESVNPLILRFMRLVIEEIDYSAEQVKDAIDWHRDCDTHGNRD